ncbi:MAG: RDD family protein [Thermoguttaceae bacterium]
MEFLPITLNGEKVYAGFWIRLCARFADAFIIMPIAFSFVWLKGFDRTLAIAITIPSSILFAMYNVFFNARFGGTPGKLAVGIRITRPDGSPIGWTEAWKRSAVDLVFAFIVLVVQVWGLTQVDPGRYASLGWIERARLVNEYAPMWYSSVSILEQAWIWSEVVVLLFNNRRRAIHDFIAGTVVVKKEFAEYESGYVRK